MSFTLSGFWIFVLVLFLFFFFFFASSQTVPPCSMRLFIDIVFVVEFLLLDHLYRRRLHCTVILVDVIFYFCLPDFVLHFCCCVLGRMYILSERMSHAFVSGYSLDSGKCGSKISMEKKKEIIHEIARKSKAAPEILRSLTRSDLLEIICAEMGKEMNYTGYSKSQMIEYLLKLVSQKSDRSNTHASLLDKAQTGHKRPRNTNRTSVQLLDSNNTSMEIDEESVEVKLCRNVACKAPLNPEFAFCKRCSCCICHCYDDNKDPSLWLTCGSDPSNENDSCGMSCHLECALKHERTGIVKNGLCEKLDGSFYCVSCGKINGLMGYVIVCSLFLLS